MINKVSSLLNVLLVCVFVIGSVHARAQTDLSNTLVYAGENEDTINPLLNNHQELPTIIFSGLMKYDAKGHPVEDLALNYQFDADTLTYTFTLRPDVRWHDGVPFSADDVVFTYDALVHDKNLASTITTNYEDIVSIHAPDEETIVFRLSRFNAAMLDNFTIGILPEHLFKGKDISIAPANQKPAGTGRYRFVDWDTAGGMIILEKNTDYYGKVPSIDRIIYKTVAVESAKALMLQSGEADLAWLNAKYADIFRGHLQYKNIDFDTADFRSVAFDFRTGFWQKNKDSIGILHYAIDQELIVKSVLNGQGLPAYSPIQLNPLGSNQEANIYTYDLAKFADEMARLGWVEGDDGIYRRNGMRFSFTIQVRDYEEERVDIIKVLARQLKAAGVEMKIALVTKFDWKAGYHGFLAGFSAEFDPDQVYKNFVTGASDNTMTYSNEEVDHLLMSARHTADIHERKKLYGEFEEVYARQPGQLLVAYLKGNYVSIAGLSGLDTDRVLGHHAAGVMWNIEEWELNR